MMTIYSIYLGYLFATASDPKRRATARERFIKVIASTLIVIGLASVLSVINVNFNSVQGSIGGKSGEIGRAHV